MSCAKPKDRFPARLGLFGRSESILSQPDRFAKWPRHRTNAAETDTRRPLCRGPGLRIDLTQINSA